MKTKITLVASFAALVGAVALPALAHADVLTLHGSVLGGGGGGVGIGGDRSGDAFHEGATGGIYGASVGLEFLFFDASLEHHQHRGGDGLLGTWSQIMFGLDIEFDIGEMKGGSVDAGGKKTGGYSSAFGELGMGLGFGVGTGQQVQPPLDNAQITDKGFVAQAHFAIGYRMTRALSLGLMVPVQAGYMFKTGTGAVVNDLGTHYQSVQAAGLLELRLAFKLK